MDGGELPGYVLPDDGAYKKRDRKPNPHPDSKLYRTHPFDDPKKHDKAREHIGDDETPNNLNEYLPWLGCLHIGHGVRCHALQLHHLLAEHDVPHRAHDKRRNSRHDDGQIVYSKHKPVVRLFCVDSIEPYSARPTCSGRRKANHPMATYQAWTSMTKMRSVRPATPSPAAIVSYWNVRKKSTSSRSVSGLPNNSQVPNRRQRGMPRRKNPVARKVSTGIPQPRMKPVMWRKNDSKVKMAHITDPSPDSASNTAQALRAADRPLASMVWNTPNTPARIRSPFSKKAALKRKPLEPMPRPLKGWVIIPVIPPDTPHSFFVAGRIKPRAIQASVNRIGPATAPSASHRAVTEVAGKPFIVVALSPLEVVVAILNSPSGC